MRRARIAIAGLALIAAAGCGGAGGARHRTLKFDSQLSSNSNVRVLPSASIGQQLIFTAQLFAPHGPVALGRSQASCTRTAPGDGAVYDCQLVFTLRGGNLYGLSAASHSGPAAGAIAGGTGNYAGTRGTFLYAATGDPRLMLTFTLTG